MEEIILKKQGKLVAYYTDLNITQMKTHDSNDGDLRNQHLKSFFVNAILTGHIRDPIMTGLLKGFGIPVDLVLKP